MATGLVFDIQRFSIHDGPGIRTTVFLKGCPLSCLWCHNPESQETGVEVFFTAASCIGCLFCVRTCERHCHHMVQGAHVFDRAGCVRCGTCAKECHPQALEVAGREMSVEAVIAEVSKDVTFYEHSGGGMTVSGGEPMLQFEFARDLLAGARAAGLHTCMETCGYAAQERMLALCPLVDLFLYDIKETDDARHREFTGVSNQPILANLAALDAAGAAIVLRCAVVPGFNDRAEHFQAVARLAERYANVRSVEVLPYHPLGISKEQRLGREPRLHGIRIPDDEVVGRWIDAIRAGTAKPVVRN